MTQRFACSVLFAMVISSLAICSFLLTSCAPAKTGIQTVRHDTVAVWQIESLSPVSSANMDMGELFSSQIMEVIKKKSMYRVVEREQLVLALEELNLSTTSLADQNTRLRLGQLVGAHLMVFGVYQVIADMMRIDLRLVNVETGKILNAVSKTTQGSDVGVWLDTVRNAAENLL